MSTYRPSVFSGGASLFLFSVLIGLSYGQTGPSSVGVDSGESKNSPWRAQVEAAEGELKKGNWDRVIQIASQILQADKKFAKAYVLRGNAHHGKLDFDSAIKDFDLAISESKRQAETLEMRAEALVSKSAALYEQGKYLAAIDAAYLASIEKSDFANAHLARAKAYFPRSEFDKAIRSLNRVIQLIPNHAEAYSLRGQAYLAKNNPGQAIKDQDKSIELDGKYALAFSRRAEAYFSKKDMASTVKNIESALSLQPTLPDALCQRAYLQAMKKEYGKALSDIDAAIKTNPRFIPAHILRGKTLIAQGNKEEALKSFHKAISIRDDAPAYTARGLLYYDKKEYEKSLQDFTRAIAIDARLAAAYQGRAQTLKKLGREEESKEDTAKFKELSPKPPEKKSDKDKEKDKKEDPPPIPKFVVKSKGVDPLSIESVKATARKIDALVAENHQKLSIKPNPKTNDSQFVRRVYLDIVGTIPNYRQVSKFLDSNDPDKRSKLIDELLSSEGYASHYFNYWADILRYKDQLNNNVRGEPFRQWLKQSLAENKTWNRMVYEMLTAEGSIWDNPATGYLQRDPGMQLDVVNNTTRIFLGTRIGCAQCHNHPFDKWTQKEFYEMAAFLFPTLPSAAGTDKRFWEKNPAQQLKEEYAKFEQEEEERRLNRNRFDRMISMNMALVNDMLDRKIKLPKDYAYDDAKPGTVVPPKTLFGKPAEIKDGEPARRAFARWMVSKDNPRFAKTIANRLWRQVFGQGLIEPVDDMMDDTVAENPNLMDFLEAEMKRLNFDLKEYLRVLMHTEVYQRQACTEDIPVGSIYHFPGPVLRRMTAEQVWDSFLTLAVDPIDYRELPSEVKKSYLKLDVADATVEELLEADRMSAKLDAERNSQLARFKYKGELLARASELPSPLPPNHFLRMFGQSDRELIAGSSMTGSVPQILLMYNGPISHMLLEKNSTIYNNIVKRNTLNGGIRAVFLTVLSREPDAEEIAIASEEIKKNGAAGYGNVVWSLANTREFLFIQ